MDNETVLKSQRDRLLETLQRSPNFVIEMQTNWLNRNARCYGCRLWIGIEYRACVWRKLPNLQQDCKSHSLLNARRI